MLSRNKIIIIAIVVLVIGYVAGRMHYKMILKKSATPPTAEGENVPVVTETTTTTVETKDTPVV